ncbi:MAG TPA: ABC transporter substrate-binding protein [Candidatus Limnocylindria bacterium]
MRNPRMLAVGAAVLALLVSACTPGGSESPNPSSGSPSTPAELPSVIVGSADFDESAIVAELYAQALEAAGFEVERNLYLGPRETTLPAMESGDINLMPEYLGGLADGAGAESSADPDETSANLTDALVDRGLQVLAHSPASDSDGFAVTAETAEEFSLVTMTDLAGVADQLIWGVPPECFGRELCELGLNEVYGIDLNALTVENVGACSPATAEALDAGAIQVGRVCTTQPQIALYNLVVLEDDQGLNPAQNLVPLVTTELAEAGGDLLASTLNAVSEHLTSEELIGLNLQVTVDQEDIAEVCQAWLEGQGLL